MKKTLLTFLVCQILLLTNVNAQSGTLTIGVVIPESSSELNQEQIQKLTSKITQIVNNSNDVTVGYTNDIVIYPVVSIEETGSIEGGLQNITVITIELSLFIKQVGANLTYNSLSKKLKGSGGNRPQAILNALSQIKTNDEVYKNFILDSKTKILKYYSDNCQNIIHTSESLSAKQDYEQSISVLQSIPPVVDCYTDAQKKSIEAYQRYQSILCTKNITKAKTAIAIKNYEEALSELDVIDPTSSCYTQVQNLITQIESAVNKKEQRDVDLEKFRINAVKEIAKAYYSRSIKLVQYNVLVH